MRFGFAGRIGVLLGLGAVCCSAQRVGIGVTGGIPLTSPLAATSPAFESAVERWTVGPALDLRLAGGFFLRLEARYREFSYRRRALPRGTGPAAAFHRTIGRWEFPLLLGYRAGRAKLQPFLNAGMSLNRISGAETLQGDPAELRHRQAMGYALGGGFEIGRGRVRLAPEVRYTHWGDRNFGVKDAALRSNLDQVDLLVGLRFAVW